MKNRAIFFFVLFAAVSLGIWLSIRHPKEAARSNDQTELNEEGIVTNSPNKTRQPQKTVGVDAAAKKLQTLEQKRTLNHANVEFFGKVEDQFGNAMPNTEIEFNVHYDTGLDSGVKDGKRTTDERGLFSITGYKGESLNVTPKKSGYVMIATNGGFIYSSFWPPESRHIPNPNNPVVIRMWKLQGAEELIRIDKRYRLALSKDPIHVDFKTGSQVATAGDLKITVTRGNGSLSKRSPVEWSIRLEAVNGAILEVDETQLQNTFLAPETGYREFWEYKMNPQEQTWFDNLNAAFFLKSRNGQVYAKFRFFIRMNETESDKVAVSISGVVNAHGSRNWEEDPNRIRGPQ